MHNNRPFSKLKKVIDSLFDDKLKMEFCCIAYPVRGQWASHNAVPRFYLKIGKEIIWDFPKDFQVKELNFHLWADNNNISNLLREYIDTPLDQLLDKEFTFETNQFTNYMDWNQQEVLTIAYQLTVLFKAADRRLGKEKLMQWAKQVANPQVDRILAMRFHKPQLGGVTD